MNLFIGCNWKSKTDHLGKKSGMRADIWTYIYFNTAFNLFLFLHGENFENSNISDK